MKGGSIALTVLAPVVAIVMVVVLVFTVIIGGGSQPDASADCAATGAAVTVASGTLPATVGPYSGAQLTNAAAILTIGQQRGLDQHAQQTALIAAMTESSLTNLTGGDRDSVGLFQMRPSQGWGTPTQINNISYAIGLFYTHLVAVPGWETKTSGNAAQAVEGSAFPDRYATHLPEAVQLMNALSGVTVKTVSDTTTGPTCTDGATATAASALIPGEQAPTGPHAAVVARVIAFAKAQLGDAYVLGGAGPTVWDCSGLTKEAYASVGINIDDGHSATTQWRNGVARGQMHPLSQVQPGDLIFWGGNNAWHVGISVGGNQMVAATRPGSMVKTETVWGTPNSQVWRPVDGL
ncbi:hypothetical protein AX769_22495 (plasmid) [Frondihabitans sp. PAMC 28766]|nr:hypothetical protein AX769_22495 [Frondihabitans sp. PAMC 28766]